MRITLDFDSSSRFKVVTAYVALRVISDLIGEGYEPQIRKSASGRGFHLKVHGLKISFETSLTLRKLLGDDRVRVELDLERAMKPKQLLFTVKDGSKAEVWRAV